MSVCQWNQFTMYVLCLASELDLLAHSSKLAMCVQGEFLASRASLNQVELRVSNICDVDVRLPFTVFGPRLYVNASDPDCLSHSSDFPNHG